MMMPEVPKDPRQLARDILSGKITIEEVAKARRAEIEAGQRARGASPTQRVPDRIPLPNVPPTKPGVIRGPVPQGPVARRPVQKIPTPPPKKPVETRRTQEAPANQQRTTQSPPRRTTAIPPVAVRPMPPSGTNVTTGGAGALNPAVPTNASPALRAMPVGSAPMASQGSPGGIRAMMSQQQTLRQAVLMSEILGRPVSLRDGW